MPSNNPEQSTNGDLITFRPDDIGWALRDFGEGTHFDRALVGLVNTPDEFKDCYSAMLVEGLKQTSDRYREVIQPRAFEPMMKNVWLGALLTRQLVNAQLGRQGQVFAKYQDFFRDRSKPGPRVAELLSDLEVGSLSKDYSLEISSHDRKFAVRLLSFIQQGNQGGEFGNDSHSFEVYFVNLGAAVGLEIALTLAAENDAIVAKK